MDEATLVDKLKSLLEEGYAYVGLNDDGYEYHKNDILLWEEKVREVLRNG